MARLERRREGRERKRWDLEQRLYQQEPKLRDLDRALRGTMVELTDLIAAGKPVQADGPEISAIRQKNLDLQAQRAELLHALGYPPTPWSRKPACPKCGDTGWNGTEMCSCLKQLCTQEQIKELTSLLNLTEEQSFARLRLDVYSDRPWQGMARSPRENMTRGRRSMRRVCPPVSKLPIKKPFAVWWYWSGQDLFVRLHRPGGVGAGLLRGVRHRHQPVRRL